MRPLVSVIVPVLDESVMLSAALDRLALCEESVEIIVVDGGSTDGTVSIATRHPARPRVLTAPPLPTGRAAQLNVAARQASASVLLFLHVDTTLPMSTWRSIAGAIEDPGVVGGNFRLEFDGDDRFARLLGGLYAALRRVGVYYGDSAVFVRADVFRALGGFRPLPVMDDYDFARRLERRGRTVCLPGPALTSGRRWKRFGIGRTLASWIAIQTLYMAGFPPNRLARLYRPAR